MICKTIMIINLTMLPITQQDAKVIPTAIKTCKKSNMCPKKITKKEENVFHVICEEPVNEEQCEECLRQYRVCFEREIYKNESKNINDCLPKLEQCEKGLKCE